MKRSGIMDIENTIIRAATPDDAEEILKIYAPYVLNTAITFEYEVPSLGEFRGRMEKTLQKYPYLAAVSGGEIAGYAYTGAFVGRTAYDWAAETTPHSREVIELCLSHAVAGSTEAAYWRSDLLEKRRALMNEWGKFIAPADCV